MTPRTSETQCKRFPNELAYELKYIRVDLLFSQDGFDEAYDPTELAESIKAHGVILPMVITRMEEPNHCYAVVDGAKRLMALRSIKADYAPCIVVDDAGACSLTMTRKTGRMLTHEQRERLVERLQELLEEEFPDD